jgi:CHASE3 domain sensor protein
MSTLDSVFLIITGCAISLFFLLGVVVLAFVLKLIKSIREVIKKAEDAIDSVESATETIKNIGQNASGPLAALKVVNNIVKLVNRK